MPKIGFVLSGEGARGASQAKSINDLESIHGITPDYVSGISSGALNSVVLSATNASVLLEFWRNTKSIRDGMALNWDFFLNTGLMNLKPLEKRLAPIAQNKINIDAEIAYASSISGQIHWQSIKKGSLAGSHTESLMRAVTIWGLISMRSGFFDAGCMNLAPVTRTIASRRDLERVYVILGRSPYRASSWRPSRGLFGFASALYRAVDLMMHSILMQDLYAVRKIPFWEKQIYVVYPEVELGSPLDFKSCRAWTEVTPVIKAWN